MPDFLLIYSRSYNVKEIQPSPQQYQNSIADWKHWYKIIDFQNRIEEPIKCWDCDGVIVFPRFMNTKPCIEVMESKGGFTFLQAIDYEEAVEIAKHCPMLQLGGTVEIRLLKTKESFRR